MRNAFPLFQSHLDLAQDYWSQLVQIGDTVIDATCGNGFDTFKLCQLALSNDKGKVIAIDRQSQAIASTRHYLDAHLPIELMERVGFYHQCHSTFPHYLQQAEVKLIVYNLGYLPGGDKSETTETLTTLLSLTEGQKLVKPGGAICITCYPGHPEGANEQEALLAYAAQLPPKEWSCCRHSWLNRHLAPTLLLIQKSLQQPDSKEEDGPPH
jgi:putative rRNA methylase